MRILLFTLLVMIMGCDSEKNDSKSRAVNDAAAVELEIVNFHQSLRRAYNGAAINTDSLVDRFFDRNSYYVTYWGLSEPIDSTKTRLRNAIPRIKDYENRMESLFIKVYGDGAYAFFILRQTYSLNGILMDEYLPTTYVLERHGEQWVVVHSQRSADFQTIQHLMEIARQREESAHQNKDQ
jgi:hypothetical protein